MLQPVKCLQHGASIRKFIDESKHFDTSDFLEREASRGNVDAKNLLAIENASEIAKRIIQQYYEDILKCIRRESRVEGSFILKCKNTENLTVCPQLDQEFVHLEKVLENGEDGHAIYVRVDNVKKILYVHDSMGKDAYLNEFTDIFEDRYPGYKIIDKSQGHQPTGGFIQSTVESFKWNMSIKGNPQYLKKALLVSQYDELSQHHFCYIESFVAMMYDMLHMKRNGPHDPRDRLIFIKKVVWGLIHKFHRGCRDDKVWKYFEEIFPHAMLTRNMDGTRLRMKDQTFQIPKGTNFKKIIRKIEMEKIDDSWSLRDILLWSAKSQ